MFYIVQNFKYKIKEDLKLYKPKEAESTFLEIITNKIYLLLLDVFTNTLL